MASQSGVTTRLQSRKARELTCRHGNGVKKRSKDKLGDIEEENADCVGVMYSRRSFPLQRENDHGQRETKNTSKTESFAKQKRTLSEIGENVEKGQNINHKFQQQQQQQQHHGAVSKPKPNHAKNRSKVESLFFVNDLEQFKASTDASSVFSMETEVSIMETSLTDTPRGIPYGVEDIDFDPDCLTTTVYSQDIIKYMMYLESRDVLDHGFLDNSPAITTKMRGVLMDWLLQVQNHEELEDETLHLCVDMIDKFLSIVSVEMPKLQLVGISCLLIASKFIQRFSPEISTLCFLTDNTFDKEDVLNYERLILHKLKFDLSRPVCTSFLCRFLQVHEHPEEVGYLASYLLDLTTTNVHLMPILPSLKAASALYLARQILLYPEPPWTRNLQFYTCYSHEALLDVACELANLLARAPTSKNQGARNKYNSERYKFISYHYKVDIDNDLLRQLRARDIIE